MDERIFPLEIGQPIPEWNLKHRLPIDKPVSPECKDTGTIFRINSTYMDVTDQPFKDRQWQATGVLLSVLISGILLAGLVKITLLPSLTMDVPTFFIYFIGVASIISFCHKAFKYGRDEFFSLSRRPIRFNRKEKKIYAIRRRRFFAKPGQGDITWEIPWNEKAIFCIHKGYFHHSPYYHIRHYEVDENDNVIRAFSIGRKWEEKENLQGLLSQWNYWCWFMNHGPEKLPKPPLFFSERENIQESFLFCLYSVGLRASPAYRISMMPFILLMTAHRLIALWTCRDPIWPLCIERVSAISPDALYDEPSPGTPVGWAQTVHALDRDKYPDNPKCDVPNWSGEKNPALNALLWDEDQPPRQ